VSGDESTAEEIIEMGVEILFPGGRPDELKEAAKQWRQLKTEVEGICQALNKDVERVVGGSWKGPAADAFREHWRSFKNAVEDATGEFDDAAKGLSDAADDIEAVNGEIQSIAIEIGISAALSLGMSVFTLGVSAAAGTARVAMLVKRALDAAGRLGQLLRAIAASFRTLYSSGTMGRLAGEGIVNFTTGYLGGTATSLLSGKGLEVETNLAGALGGATVGTAASKGATALGRGDLISGVAGGAAGGVAGDALNTTPLFSDKKFDVRETVITGITGGASGGTASLARGAHNGMGEFAHSVRNENDFSYSGPRAEHEGVVGDSTAGGAVSIAGGVSANTGKDALADLDASAETARSDAAEATPVGGSTATDRIREDFG
jgi:WXG100 family type VII secretion target